eukprot:scaffold84271_cov57-Phaeocystis_antarctica.AAC.1
MMSEEPTTRRAKPKVARGRGSGSGQSNLRHRTTFSNTARKLLVALHVTSLPSARSSALLGARRRLGGGGPETRSCSHRPART